MDTVIQHLLKTVAPRTIHCMADTELEDDTKGFDEHEAPHLPHSVGRVPTFESFLHPIQAVTSKHSFIKGFRFEFNMGLSQYFQMTHSWSMPHSASGGAAARAPMNPMDPTKQPPKPTYTFSANYVTNIKNNDPQSIMQARIDGDGKLEAFFIQRLAPNLTARLSGMFMNSNVDNGILALDVDLENKNNTSGVKITRGFFNLFHMERVHKNLILGFDYSNILQQGISVFGYAAKFRFHSHNFYLQHLASQAQTHFGYSIPIKAGTNFVSTLIQDHRENKMTTKLGLKQRYYNSEIIAILNSKGKVSTALTIFGNPSPYSLKLCASVNFVKDTYKFGYGFTIGNSQ